MLGLWPRHQAGNETEAKCDFRWRGEPLAFRHQAEQYLGRLRLGHREFVGQLPHTELAL